MSLKGDKYETHEEITFRILNTVVTYEGRPVYITKVNLPEVIEEKKEIARVHFVELPYAPVIYDKYGEPVRNNPVKNDVRKYLSSKNFDLAPFKMGYFNCDGAAHFVSRNPVRQNQQGLSAKTCVFTNAKGGRSDIGFNKMIGCQGFVDMVAGKYPTFKEVGELLGDHDNSSVAVSRSFAFIIDHDLEVLLLMHKGIKCGIAQAGDKGIKLPPKFHFLKHEAEECGIPLA